jgi:hypothetical protein
MQNLHNKIDNRRYLFVDRLKSYLNTCFIWIVIESYLKNYLRKFKSSNSATFLIYRFINSQIDLFLKILMLLTFWFTEQFMVIDRWACRILDIFEGINVKTTFILDSLTVIYLNTAKKMKYFFTYYLEFYNKANAKSIKISFHFHFLLKIAYDFIEVLTELLESIIEKIILRRHHHYDNDEKYNEILSYMRQYKTQKEIKNNIEYISVKNRIKILLLILFQVLRIRINRYMDNNKLIIYLFKKLNIQYLSLISFFKSNIKDRLDLKDKLDLYKEYIDVLCKQFIVQDGRSLENVKVFFIYFLINKIKIPLTCLIILVI